jgi:phosphoribosylanthranilate isomerase
MFVKICGITNRKDLQAAVEAGADALGFVFEPQSKRFIGHQPKWWEWVSEIPMNVRSVLVTATPDTAPAQFIDCFDTLQCYAPDVSDPDAWLQGIPSKFALWLAFRVSAESSYDQILARMNRWARHAERFLLDTHDPQQIGGTGKTMDWTLAKTVCADAPRPVLLAGGLTPDNVAEAIQTVQPAGVDVSTGVELKPGKKNHEKVRAFIGQARFSDNSTG